MMSVSQPRGALILTGVLFLASACSFQHAKRPSLDVTYQGNYLLFKGKRFTGVLEERFDQVGTTRKTEYRDGLMDGLQEEFFDNGQRASRRDYSLGQRVGVHEGWFSNGHRRFHHEFRDGVNHGEAWEWYDNGALAIYASFDNGRLLGKKMWRETGQIYMNYVFPKGRAVGLPGTKLCYQVRNER
jgi:antitoxin component YwqK of YwqJK toxin-antitoxin module